MKPSSARTSAIALLELRRRASTTFAFRAVMALRMRVSISAIGSVIVMSLTSST